MNWYKKSQAMFDTFNMEYKIVNSFNEHLNKKIKEYGIQYLQKYLNKNKELYTGSSNISEAMQPITNKYGKPRNPIPKQIDFFVLTSNAPNITPETKAKFEMYNNRFIIAIILNNLNNFDKNTIKYSIIHELQHFLKTLYEGIKLQYEDKEKVNFARDLFSNQEIQAYSTSLARKTIDFIKDMFKIRTQNMTPQQSNHILNTLNTQRNQIISKYLNQNLKNFISKIEDKIKEPLKDNIKRQYYEATIKNFNKLFDRFIEEFTT